MDPRAEKLNEIIEDGKVHVTEILQGVQTEFDRRKDVIVKPGSLDYKINSGIELEIAGEDEPFQLTNFARNQLLAKASIPVSFAERLMNLGETQLLKDNLGILNNRLNDDGLMLREVDNTVKGVLSPSYRRMDGAPIIGSFVEAAVEAGYVPYNGRITDYRYNVSFILPEVFQPGENEFLVLGLAITTGDYGSAALQIEMVVLRITCRNLMMGTNVMRSIHIGKRFNAEDDIVRLSNETHKLDNKAVASAVSDAVKSSIDLQAQVRKQITESATNEKFINIDNEIAKLRKKGFSKDITEKIKSTYESELPVEVLPKENNSWRLANAMSFIANNSKIHSDLSLDLQKASMEVL